MEVDSPRAWLTVVAAFLASAVTLGTAYSFGAFFESMSEEFGSERGATAVIFGFTTFAFFWLSIITGRLVDRFGPRVVLSIGAAALFSRLDADEPGRLARPRLRHLRARGRHRRGVWLCPDGGDGRRLVRASNARVAVGLAVAGIGVGTHGDVAAVGGAHRPLRLA